MSEWGIDAWREFQAKDWAGYKEKGRSLGYYSVPEFRSTEDIAKLLGGIAGPVLDVGCGVLPMPNYLKLVGNAYGIDPFWGEGPRCFPFAQAMGEWLPFKDGCFAAALSMSALDHALDPQVTLRECWRVLCDGGGLYIWYEDQRKDKYHPWVLTTDGLLEWTEFGFERVDQRHYAGGRGYSQTDLMVLRKTND